jgi:hypothetical protein
MKKLTQKHLLAPTALLTAGVALLSPLRAVAAVDCNNLGVLKALPGICGAEDFNAVINAIVTWLMGILGVVLAIVILASAVQIVSSGGSPEAIKSAKSRLTQAAVSLGLLISFRAILALLGVQ